jgi:hypothetical protein
MKLGEPKPSREPWDQEDDRTFLSPPIGSHWEQILLFPACSGKNYTVSLGITPIDGVKINGKRSKEATVVFRHRGSNRYYYAGLGGWGGRIFLGKVEVLHEKDTWSRLLVQQTADQIQFGATYHLRIECRDHQLLLAEDDRIQFNQNDDTYSEGCIGLRTVNSQARFSEIAVRPNEPRQLRAFVLMPFSPIFRFVWEVIRTTVEDLGIECDRADTRSLPTPITQDVKNQILSADIVLSDLSSQNPNVYYESGYAHALGRNLILIAQSSEDLAFAVRDYRTVLYSSPDQLREGLRKVIRQVLAEEKLEKFLRQE